MLIQPLEAGAEPQIDELLQFFRDANGYEPNSLLIMQRRPAITSALIDLHKAVIDTHARVTPEHKLLLAHLTSTAAGCRYCQVHTAYTAERIGASEARVNEIWNFRDSDLFSDAEKAAFELAVAAGVTPNAVTPEMTENARRYWDDGELVEIVSIISLFGFMNRWNDTIGTPLEEKPLSYGQRRLSSSGWVPGRHAEDGNGDAREVV